MSVRKLVLVVFGTESARSRWLSSMMLGKDVIYRRATRMIEVGDVVFHMKVIRQTEDIENLRGIRANVIIEDVSVAAMPDHVVEVWAYVKGSFLPP